MLEEQVGGTGDRRDGCVDTPPLRSGGERWPVHVQGACFVLQPAPDKSGALAFQLRPLEVFVPEQGKGISISERKHCSTGGRGQFLQQSKVFVVGEVELALNDQCAMEVILQPDGEAEYRAFHTDHATHALLCPMQVTLGTPLLQCYNGGAPSDGMVLTPCFRQVIDDDSLYRSASTAYGAAS